MSVDSLCKTTTIRNCGHKKNTGYCTTHNSFFVSTSQFTHIFITWVPILLVRATYFTAVWKVGCCHTLAGHCDKRAAVNWPSICAVSRDGKGKGSFRAELGAGRGGRGGSWWHLPDPIPSFSGCPTSFLCLEKTKMEAIHQQSSSLAGEQGNNTFYWLNFITNFFFTYLLLAVQSSPPIGWSRSSASVAASLPMVGNGTGQ